MRITAEDAINTLVSEGHDRDDAVAAFDSLIDAGLELAQPDDGCVITPEELDVLRDQLNESRRIHREKVREAAHRVGDISKELNERLKDK